MTTRDLIEQLSQLDLELQVLVWDSKGNCFAENFALSATLFEELLITPMSSAEELEPVFARMPVSRNQLHFQIP